MHANCQCESLPLDILRERNRRKSFDKHGKYCKLIVCEYCSAEGNFMTKALISVTGLDTTGIIASVATKLSELNINILEITQTILDGYFTMMMVVDLDGAQMDFSRVNAEFEPVRKELKLDIHMQRMDIFDAMHRI